MPQHRFGGDVTLINGDLDLDTGDLAVTLGDLDVPAGDVQVGAAQEFQIGPVMLSVSDGPPTAGAHVVGDRYVNNGGIFAGIEGWVCVAAGTPGVWAPYGIDPALRSHETEDFIVPAGGTLPQGWAYLDVQSAVGAINGDYVDDAANGEYAITPDGQAEIQTGILYGGDNYWLDTRENAIVTWRGKVTIDTAFQATDFAIFGVCDAWTAGVIPNDVARVAWFELRSGLAIWARTDDVATGNVIADTGAVWVDDTFLVLSIDFSNLADVRFYVNGVDVTPAGPFDMSGIGANPLQQVMALYMNNVTGNAHVVTADLFDGHAERP